MSPAFPARRRAEQFDALVEGTSTATSDAALGELIDLVTTLRTAPRIEARPEFVFTLRERLMVAASTELVAPVTARDAKAQIVRPQRSGRDRRLATALGGFALVGATASMAVAAQHALPGDQLYPMKRTLENAKVNLSHGNDAKGSNLLANASDRLDEVDALTDGNHHATSQVISQTLVAFTDQANQASTLLIDAYNEDGDAGAITELAVFTQHSNATLTKLAPEVPADAQGALAAARITIVNIQDAASAACFECTQQVLDDASPVFAIVPHPHAPVAPPSPVGVTLPTTLPTPTASTVLPTTLPTDPPSAATTAPSTEAPTATDTPAGTPTGEPTPPGVFPTQPSTSTSASSSNGGSSSSGGLGPTVSHLLDHSGTTANPSSPLSPGAIPSVLNQVTAPLGTVLSGSAPSDQPSSDASSSASTSTTSSNTTKHHHHHPKTPKDQQGTTDDSAQQPDGTANGGLDILGD